jgi:prevent-host-death family protein
VKPVSSEDARRNFRDLLNDVEHKKEHVTIMRYRTPAVVIVPISWYERTVKALAATRAGTEIPDNASGVE